MKNPCRNIIKKFNPKWNMNFLEVREENVSDAQSLEVSLLAYKVLYAFSLFVEPFQLMDSVIIPLYMVTVVVWPNDTYSK